MTDEFEMFEQIADAWPTGDEQPSPQLAALVHQALAEFPASSEVWVMYGDFLQISDNDREPEATLENAMAAYTKALDLDPACAEAHQELGFLHDIHHDDLAASRESFRAAISFGAGADSYYGLARVVAQQGQPEEACELLAPENCPFASDPAIRELLDEIKAGMWS